MKGSLTPWHQRRRQSSDDKSASVAFADLVRTRFRAQRQELPDEGAHSWALFSALRRQFEETEGDIQREYWGVNMPLALALTEKPRGRLKRLFYRPPQMRLHRVILDGGEMPATYHAALYDGDILAVRAAFSLGDLSRHTVLARIFQAQEFMLKLADGSEGRLQGPNVPSEASSEQSSSSHEPG
jgi:hypothetical protein